MQRKGKCHDSSISSITAQKTSESTSFDCPPPSKCICTESATTSDHSHPSISIPSNPQSAQTTVPKPSPIEVSAGYLKSLYKHRKLPAYGKWPPTPSKQFINLAIILKKKVSRADADEFTKATLRGNRDDILQRKRLISMT